MISREQIEQTLLSLEEPMLETLKTLVSIPSVKEAAEDGAPFGRPARQALDCALEICKSLGFDCYNADGYAGHADIGEGSTEDALAILGHLDVVPVGDGWTFAPFDPVVKDGLMYGRGTSDDKGPVVAAMYAMAAIQKLHIPLKRKVRLILGTDEESGWEDIAHYRSVCQMPRQGFSPDADYPVINIEKGMLCLEVNGPLSQDGLQVIEFSVGERHNVVPGIAEALVQGDQALVSRINGLSFPFPVSAEMTDKGVKIHTEGIPGHAAMPELGRNAIGQMLLVLKELGVQGMLLSLADAIGMEYDGKSLGIRLSDDVSGPLTLNIGIIRVKDGTVSATLDLRCPILADLQGLVKRARGKLQGLTVNVLTCKEPHAVSENSELVIKLLAAYEEVTGLPGKAMAIGGGTYAKCLEEGVAFGALFPGEKEMAHQADEYISVEDLKKNMRIFTYAILKLAAQEEY